MLSRNDAVTPPPDTPAPTAPGDYWQALAQARNAEQLCQAWLPILCGMVQRTQSGLLLLQDSNGSFAPAALWPEAADLSYLRGVAEESLNTRQGVVQRDADGQTRFAYPLVNGDELFGVVILDLHAADELALTHARRLLHWGVGWLIDLFNRRALLEQGARLERSAYLFDLALAALSEADFGKSSLAVVNRLAQRFNCHQVLFGLEKGKTVRVETVSHSAWFEEKANLVNLAAQAMNEAFDQRSRIVVPEPESGATLITAACRRYLEDSGSHALCALPLEAGNRVAGVWLLERDEPFSDEELDVLDALTLTLGPIMALKLNVEESLFSHTRRAWSHGLRKLTDTSRPGYKLLAIAIALLLAVLALYQTDYRVASQAVVEGATQRVAVAPFQGYIQSAPKRAGDVVHAGEVLATLEDRDLRLEKVRWEAELQVSLRKEQEAMSKGERVDFRLASAQANQARAQLNLAEEKLARVRVVAPFDGVVVRGDLSQQLGSPVEQGKVLFELAPLEAWRVILKVDERDIADVRAGQPGELMLTSLPGQAFPFRVKKVTPVATAEDGRNYFRVEAGLTLKKGATLPKMRPNMEGVGKVEAGEQSLLWIWTHRLGDWLRLTLWRWMP
ncbi:MAG: HlyD family efflux transporter periplasmic adaptor subunit [Gallionellaceae bacterium]|nr:HlyD family efflux transporter periplasmic adaptor subunit [Gallionellaceae bacterium]